MILREITFAFAYCLLDRLLDQPGRHDLELRLFAASLKKDGSLMIEERSEEELTSFAAFVLIFLNPSGFFHFLFDHIENIVRNAQVFDGGPANVDFGHAPESISILKVKF